LERLSMTITDWRVAAVVALFLLVLVLGLAGKDDVLRELLTFVRRSSRRTAVDAREPRDLPE
jgi:hypothetical protein